MSDPPSTDSGAGLDAFQAHAADASASAVTLGKDGAAAAASIDAAFAKAGDSLAKTLSKAASDGKISFGELASAAIQAVDVFARASAGGAGTTGLADALGGVLKGVFQARADGGPVLGGDSYLVGERGPEVFRPSTAGDVSSLGAGGGTTVNVTVQGGGASSILRSEAQIAAALARAVSLGASGRFR